MDPSGVLPGQPAWKVGRVAPGFRKVTVCISSLSIRQVTESPA